MEKEIVDKDYVPPQAINVFATQIPGNQDLRLEQTVQHEGLNQYLGSFEKLAKPVQNAIEQIRSVDTIGEKAAIAHSFSQSYITDKLQFGDDKYVFFEDLANNPVGDCDDHQTFMSGLLLYGGVNPRDIFMLSGMVSYSGYAGDMKLGHAFVVVKDGDEYILLDNNMAGTLPIDPKNPVANGMAADLEGDVVVNDGKPVNLRVEINYLTNAVNGRGTMFESGEAFAKLQKYMEVFLSDLKAKLSPSSKKAHLNSAMPDFDNASNPVQSRISDIPPNMSIDSLDTDSKLPNMSIGKPMP